MIGPALRTQRSASPVQPRALPRAPRRAGAAGPRPRLGAPAKADAPSRGHASNARPHAKPQTRRGSRARWPWPSPARPGARRSLRLANGLVRTARRVALGVRVGARTRQLPLREDLVLRADLLPFEVTLQDLPHAGGIPRLRGKRG